MTNDRNKRIEYLDIARGIGIFLVVLGHCYSLPEWMWHLIYSVHMPLFFVLSGYVFKPAQSGGSGKGSGLGAFIAKSAKALLLPYVLTCGIVIVLQMILAAATGGNVLDTLWSWVVTAVYGAGTHEITLPGFVTATGLPIGNIGAIWFLLALFVARVLLALCLKSRTPFVWVMILFFTSLVTTQHIGWLPFSIQAGMGALLFLYLGYLLKRLDLLAWDKVHWVAKILVLLIWVYMIIFCGKLWMVSNTYTDGVLDIIGAVCGTFVIVWIAQLLERYVRKLMGWLIFLGQITLGIMCAHMLVLSLTDATEWIRDLAIRMGVIYGISEVLVKIVGTALVTLVLYFIPGIRRILFPGRRSRRTVSS